MGLAVETLAALAASPARALVAALQARGFEAYFVGGAVRDALLDLPAKDIDIATSARLDDVLALFPRAVAVGRAFEVARVPHADGVSEVAAFRTDGAYADGRHPTSVAPASRDEDACRRDFTVNALYFDPLSGRLVDPTGGLADLEARLLRAIGDPLARYREDTLRTWRALRFAARLDFAIEPATFSALSVVAEESRRLAPERVADELTRILTGPHAERALEWAHQTGLLAVWLPEAAALVGVAQPPAFHPEGDVWEHTKRVVAALENPRPALAWAALLHDIGKPLVATTRNGVPFFPGHARAGAEAFRAVAERLRFSGALTQAVYDLIDLHMRPLDYAGMRPATRRRLFARADFREHLALWRADAIGSMAEPVLADTIAADFAAYAGAHALPAPLVTGNDLQAWGLAPGPSFRPLLTACLDAQLEGRLRTKEEARVLALALVAEAEKPSS